MTKPNAEAHRLLPQRSLGSFHGLGYLLYRRPRFRVSSQVPNVGLCVLDAGALLCCFLCNLLRGLLSHFNSDVRGFQRSPEGERQLYVGVYCNSAEMESRQFRSAVHVRLEHTTNPCRV
jgi:hypothetical protein